MSDLPSSLEKPLSMDSLRRQFLKFSSVLIGGAIAPCHPFAWVGQPESASRREARHLDLTEATGVLRQRQDSMSVEVGAWNAPFTSYDLSAIQYLVNNLGQHFRTSLEFTQLCPEAISLFGNLNSELVYWGSIRELTLASAKALALLARNRDWPFFILLHFDQDVNAEAIAILLRENSRNAGEQGPFATLAIPALTTAIAYEIAKQVNNVHLQVSSSMPSLAAGSALSRFAGQSLTIDFPACPTKRWVELMTEELHGSNRYQIDLEKFEHNRPLWRVAVHQLGR